MSSERNREEDWPILRAREDIREAEKVLKEKPTPFNALDLQYKQQALRKLSHLTLVKK